GNCLKNARRRKVRAALTSISADTWIRKAGSPPSFGENAEKPSPRPPGPAKMSTTGMDMRWVKLCKALPGWPGGPGLGKGARLQGGTGPCECMAHRIRKLLVGEELQVLDFIL